MTTYDYDPVNRRLDTMTVSNKNSKAEGAKGLFLNNIYKYDAAGNITSVENTAALNSGIGGTMSHTYDYDDWYRLIKATGKFVGSDNKSADYHLEIGYDNLYNITSKKMTMTQTNLQFAGTLSAGHEFSYNYSTDNPMQLASVETKQYNVDGEVSDVDAKLSDNKHTQNYEFDKNGNMTSVSVAPNEQQSSEAAEQNDVLKSFLWDEENRLLAVNNNGSVSCYFYDASGERTVKLTSESEMVHVNGKKVGGNANICKFTAYVSPYFVVSNGGAYTKHIYAASQRIASKLGNEDGFGADPRRVEQAGGKKYSDIQKDNIGARFSELGFAYTAPEKEKVEKDSTMDSEEPENLVFFYHPDHLGSTSYVTDADGNIAQHIEYIPYGEVFVEERNNSFSTNFLFNAKELDNETGLYYYGARYLDPTGAMWLSVDPMWEKYAGMSPYNYCAGNPVKLVDPDGEDIVGNTSSDATTLCGLINQQLTPYEGMIDGISDYFYVNGNNLDCRYENLSPILKQIKNCQKDGILDDQMANDLKDLLYGYTAGIASERSIIFSFASQQNNLVDYLYAENYGGGVCDPQYDPVTGNLTGNMECIINVPFLPNRGTPLELATHEIVGHGVNRLYDVPGADDVEAVKFSNIVRRLSGFGDRTLPHDGNQTRLRKKNPVDRAEIGTDSFWKKVVKEMDKKNK